MQPSIHLHGPRTQQDHCAGMEAGARHILCSSLTKELVTLKYKSLCGAHVQWTLLEAGETLHFDVSCCNCFDSAVRRKRRDRITAKGRVLSLVSVSSVRTSISMLCTTADCYLVLGTPWHMCRATAGASHSQYLLLMPTTALERSCCSSTPMCLARSCTPGTCGSHLRYVPDFAACWTTLVRVRLCLVPMPLFGAHRHDIKGWATPASCTKDCLNGGCTERSATTTPRCH